MHVGIQFEPGGDSRQNTSGIRLQQFQTCAHRVPPEIGDDSRRNANGIRLRILQTYAYRDWLRKPNGIRKLKKKNSTAVPLIFRTFSKKFA